MTEPIPTTLDLYNHFINIAFPLVNTSLHVNRWASDARYQNNPNPLVSCGKKVYSQNEEDGITFEILRRINIQHGVFSEFGVGNGTENNTLALACAGWNGFWVGGEELAFDFNPTQASKLNFHYQKAWIKKSNIIELFNSGLAAIEQTKCDIISLDLDGNDFYFVETLLEAGTSPELFIVEYNARFIPPLQFKIEYDDEHLWQGDDYFGASLSTFADLFNAHGYFLACCNVTGSNAFFIKNTHKALFSDVPQEIGLLYASPKYFLTGLDVSGHKISTKTIETFIARLQATTKA